VNTPDGDAAFRAALEDAATRVTEELDRLLPLSGAPEDRVVEAMRYACLNGGKRMRPFFTLQSASLFHVDPARRPGRRRRSRCCIAIPWSTTTFRRWTTTISGAACPRCTAASTRRRRSWRATPC
jgi:geranylgeranyl pyrophosphate synthase